MASNKDLNLLVPDLLTTHRIASCIAHLLVPGTVIFLHGELGAGKTTLVREILAALGHTGPAKSPTYTLVESYDLPSLLINHFDLYRVNDPIELEFIGIRDYITPSTINFFEWAEKGGEAIPSADVEITLVIIGDSRQMSLKANSACGKQILKQLANVIPLATTKR